jgi:hypothetical protein
MGRRTHWFDTHGHATRMMLASAHRLKPLRWSDDLHDARDAFTKL